MGELILIEVFVVIVIGGSARSAARSRRADRRHGRHPGPRVPQAPRGDRALARRRQAAGPALASMLIYLLMAAVLALKPQGLFPARL